jgi:hypothetical protein
MGAPAASQLFRDLCDDVHRFASAANTSARASAVSTTFDNSYASDDSVTSPRTIAHLDARSDTLAGSA